MIKKGLLLFAVALMFFASCTNYGTKKTFGKGDLYYTENITEAQADKAGAFLKEMGYLSDDKETSIQLDRVDSTYKLRLVVGEEYQEKDTSLDFSFKALGFLASISVFDSKPVEVDLCDETLNTKRTLK